MTPAEHAAEADRLLTLAAALDRDVHSIPVDQLTTQHVLAGARTAELRCLRAIGHALLAHLPDTTPKEIDLR